MPETNDIRSSVTMLIGEDKYSACLKLGTMKAFEAETGIGILAFWEQCRLRTAKLTDQSTLLVLALRASNPTWGLNKCAAVLDRLTVAEYLIYASALLNLSVLEPTAAMKKAKEEEAAEDAEETGESAEGEAEGSPPLH